MFDIYGCHFMYENFDSSRYNLIFANTETERLTSLQHAQAASTVLSRHNNIHMLTKIAYDDEQMSFDAEILSADGRPIGVSYLREIEHALFNRRTYGKLYPLEGYYDGLQPVYINCVFINPSRIENEAGVVGYSFTVLMDSTMAWEEATVQTKSISTSQTVSGTHTFTVNVDSDMNDYIYPKVIIKLGSTGGDITIKNVTDSNTRATVFSDLESQATITMDGSNNYITPAYFLNLTGRNFIRLLNGTNGFSVTGNVTSMLFEFNNRRFL